MEKGLDIVLPDQESEVKIPKENITNILIDERGNVLFANQPIQVSDINRTVRDKIRENPNMIFSLKTVRESDYKYFIAVFDQLKVGGATKISIADPDEG